MSITVGDRIPLGTFSTMGDNKPQPISSVEIFPGTKVVLVAVTGAFTPACSDNHLPGFIEQADKIKNKGVDTIVCVSVNDAFVMDAWSKAENVDRKIMMLADADGSFTKAMGMLVNVNDNGLGMRSQRYAAIIEDNVIKYLAVDEMGEVEKTTAEKVLEKL